MLIKFPSGNKSDNDKLLLDSGFIVLDNESKGIRIHDGSTVGGFESIGVEPPPRPSEFLGEVLVEDLITGNTLASMLSLSAGTAINSNEPWLKFYDEVDKKTKLISKKPYRHSLSWDDIDAAGLVYGNRTLTIAGDGYRIRLIKGANSDPTVRTTWGIDLDDAWGSEWNRLVYPICAPTGNATYDNITDPDFPGFNTWANYDQENDLILLNTGGKGAYTWCQETASNAANRIYRGGLGMGRISMASLSSTIDMYHGWRPLLELVE